MSWTDLFKSKSAKLKADDRLRWFGKLSTYADYYSSKADEEWAVEFNDWVLKGYELFLGRQRGAGQHGGRLPIGRLVLRLPKSGMTVLASVQDYGGDMRGRPFPLCFYVGVPTEQWPGPTSDRLGGAARVLAELDDLQREVTRFFKAPGRFDGVFGGRRIALDGLDGDSRDTTWTARAKQLPLAEWYAGVRDGLAAPDAASWMKLTSLWGDAIAGHGKNSDEFEATLRFPIAGGAATDVQTAGWMRWLETRMELGKRFLSLVYTQGSAGAAGRLTVVAREPLVDDFLLLTPLADTLNFVDDVCKVGARQGAAPAGGTADAAEPAAETQGSWLEFVEQPAG